MSDNPNVRSFSREDAETCNFSEGIPGMGGYGTYYFQISDDDIEALSNGGAVALDIGGEYTAIVGKKDWWTE